MFVFFFLGQLVSQQFKIYKGCAMQTNSLVVN